jgi:signal transduction histidine kinase
VDDGLDSVPATVYLGEAGIETVDDLARVSLATVARDSWETVDTGEATLDVRVDEGTRVYADATRLQSVFENLFRNALDHGDDSVTVTVERTADGFAVADDGPGVPPDEREAVFEAGHSGSPEGTGFGLSIVEQVADAHGWSVRAVESEAGGARFEVLAVDD